MNSRIHVDGSRLIGRDGKEVLLRGVGLGGWMNMENFITGYPATESQQRQAMRGRWATEGYTRFFDRFLTRLLRRRGRALPRRPRAELGAGAVQLPPLRGRRPAVRDQGARGVPPPRPGHRACAPTPASTRSSTCTPCPAGQNQHWHSDNPTHCGDVLAAPALPGPGGPPVGGHRRPLPGQAVRSPATTRSTSRPTPPARSSARSTQRLERPIRAVDPDHVLFLDGNRYSTDFSVFAEPLRQHGLHRPRLRPARHRRRRRVPGRDPRRVLRPRRSSSRRSCGAPSSCARTGTPIWIGEFGPVYTGDPERGRQRVPAAARPAGHLPRARRELGAVDLQGHRPAGPGVRRPPTARTSTGSRPALAKKSRLGVGLLGRQRAGIRHVLGPIEDLLGDRVPRLRPRTRGASSRG